jgi:hypothetical protein
MSKGRKITLVLGLVEHSKHLAIVGAMIERTLPPFLPLTGERFFNEDAKFEIARANSVAFETSPRAELSSQCYFGCSASTRERSGS